MHYLTVDEIESGLVELTKRHPTLCRLVPLPNPTFEGRTVTALRIGRPDDGGVRAGVLFLAGVHAMEWGGSDIALTFAADLLDTYAAGTDLVYGGRTFGAAEVASIIDTVDVFVVACINPDGRAYSQSTDDEWRKNRSRLSDTDNRIGTDLNRNFDFLWDIEKAFDPSVLHVPTMGSLAPASDHYVGRSAASEAETRNVVWLLDEFPQIGWLLDIHSNGGQVMHSWGDAPNQIDRPDMTFFNPRFDGLRGTPDADRYSEYIDPADKDAMEGAVEAVADAVRAVRGQDYQRIQAFARRTPGAGDHSPMSGTTIDYAYSRHLVDPGKSTVYGLAIEFGLTGEAQPPVEEMERILADVGSGMVALCLHARRPVIHVGVQEPTDFRQDFRILSGIIDGTPGWVWVDGRPVFVKPPDPRLHELLRRVGEFQSAPEVEGPTVATQRKALERIVELSRSLLDDVR
ncbi:M14 family zinc carboxypeptidase [Pseudonocardia xishanensis]|uniref:Peptidase M14 domain-containing protein n=1 Tax=Pseudonocardia xishanensis TaxID=630995 RepID=A0ABP8S1A3_9PSEU